MPHEQYGLRRNARPGVRSLGNAGQVYFAHVGRGVESAIAAIGMPPGENPRRKYPALAGNQRGEILIAWVEGAGWQRGGALGWRICDAAGRPTAACDTLTKVPVWSFPAVFAPA